MMTVDQMPTLQPLPVTKRGERRRWLVKEDWECEILGEYQRYVVPAGFIFDGASIPRLFWNILSPTGYLFIAGLIHDFIYKYAFIFTYTWYPDNRENRIYRQMLSQKEADSLFENLAEKICMGASFFTKSATLSLRLAGFMAWNEHREKKIKCEIFPEEYK
jgi:hypothetical protein